MGVVLVLLKSYQFMGAKSDFFSNSLPHFDNCLINLKSRTGKINWHRGTENISDTKEMSKR